ncbi:hypothetical protein DAPPUDRAFT_255795 [Daphnia pulex]|uniref:Uncharacterized protein n=1 Tax=Daphnia pulex TaxID=6669 RepID=E9HA26_DAPPU|nr:hypothetical protein DAPPUDRAFT_255795 [Daphnia pulex]|eukprot:EFX71352.1 hypothetical protein DAPPUDRAFT_255795 [Daphnia pulex]
MHQRPGGPIALVLYAVAIVAVLEGNQITTHRGQKMGFQSSRFLAPQHSSGGSNSSGQESKELLIHAGATTFRMFRLLANIQKKKKVPNDVRLFYYEIPACQNEYPANISKIIEFVNNPKIREYYCTAPWV